MSILILIIQFLELHEVLAYFILFLGSFFETLIGPGFYIYGEVIFLAGSILAGTGVLNIWLVSFACIFGGAIGDSSSYFIGKYLGKKIKKIIFKKQNKFLNLKNYHKGEKFFNQHGTKSIFLARFLGPLSWVTPFLAGVWKVKYKEFIKYNLPGVILGISQFLIVGYFFGYSYSLILKRAQQYSFYAVVIIMLLLIIFFILKKKRFGLNK